MENTIKYNQKIGFLAPLYKGFGQLDDLSGVSKLSDKNKKIVENLQEALVDNDESGKNKLYVADLGVTTTLSNVEHNSIELRKLYTGIKNELAHDFDVELLSTTDLKNIMSRFHGLESVIFSKKELQHYLQMLHHSSVNHLHRMIDRSYRKSILYTSVSMKNQFNPVNKNTIHKI